MIDAANAGAFWAQEEVEAGPKITQSGLFYLTCYNDLGSERHLGMAEGLIPISKIDWYASKLEMDLLEQEAFEYIIRAVDVSSLARQAKKRAKEAKRGQ